MEDQDDQGHIEKMYNYFDYMSHLCIVYEVLGASLFDKITAGQYTGSSSPLTRYFSHQLLESI